MKLKILKKAKVRDEDTFYFVTFGEGLGVSFGLCFNSLGSVRSLSSRYYSTSIKNLALKQYINTGSISLHSSLKTVVSKRLLNTPVTEFIKVYEWNQVTDELSLFSTIETEEERQAWRDEYFD